MRLIHLLANKVSYKQENPVQTIGDSANYFLSDPLKNNPIYGTYQYGKDFKKVVSAHDWDTASYKLGVGVVNTAEVAASIAIGGKIGGKIPTSKVSVPKVGVASKIRNAIDNFGTPALAGADGMVISGAVPAEASVASTAGAGALGVRVGAAIGQNVVYSANGCPDQSSDGSVSQNDLNQLSVTSAHKNTNKKINVAKPNQVHYFATNKSKKYTARFKKIANKYSLDLDDPWNKELMPHQGRHPYEYHDYVLEQMQKFDTVSKGDQHKFLNLYE